MKRWGQIARGGEGASLEPEEPAARAGREARCMRTELQVRPEALIFSQSMIGYGAAIVRAIGPLLSSIEKTPRTTSNILPPAHTPVS